MPLDAPPTMKSLEQCTFWASKNPLSFRHHILYSMPIVVRSILSFKAYKTNTFRLLHQSCRLMRSIRFLMCINCASSRFPQLLMLSTQKGINQFVIFCFEMLTSIPFDSHRMLQIFVFTCHIASHLLEVLISSRSSTPSFPWAIICAINQAAYACD